MFKELILSICIGIIFGIFLFIKTQQALKNAYSHEIRSKYALISHIASKYPQLNDDITDEDDEKDNEIYNHKFIKPLNYTDPLFNRKSLETEKLRSEFNKLFTVLDAIRDFIIRDFIEDWYKTGISNDDTKFINHIKFAIDGIFQILVHRISSTNWTYFIRDRIFHPLRECLTLYRNIVINLSRNNPKWDELTETERDNFIQEAIEKNYQWHRGCDSTKSSIEYLRKWSLLFLEEILDERNFHCFTVRFFCREVLTNNLLYPVLELVDGYNVNYGIVSAFIFLEAMNGDINNTNINHITQKQKNDMEIEEKKHDSNNMISMQDLNKIETHSKQSKIELKNEIETSENCMITQTDTHTQLHTVTQTEISMQTMHNNDMKEEKEKENKRIRKRKRRASMDMNILKHYYKSFNISDFFIEINESQSELFVLEPYEIKKGYSISCKYYIESQHKFTLRFVSKQCINLCGRWVTVIHNNEILGDLSSLKHLKRIEYENNKYIYIWDDHKLHEYGSNYLQIGRQIIVSTDIQNGNKYHKIRHLFIPLNIPLIHIYFTANNLNNSLNNSQIAKKPNTANNSISEGLAKIGSAINPMNVIDGIGEGIKKLLPKDNSSGIFTSPSTNIRSSPGNTQKKGLFGKKKKEHSFHHDIDDIGFLPSNKDKKKKDKRNDKRKKNNKETDENKLKLLASHRPTTNLTVRIWDVYRDFDTKMNPYVAYVLRIRDEIITQNNNNNNNNNNMQRIEWTIKTRFSKLHSFHKAIQRDKMLKHKNIKIVAQFPAKSIITKMDAKYIAERKKQLVAYFNTLHRYPDVLLSDAVYQLVIPPLLVDKYYQENIINSTHNTPSISEEPINDIKQDDELAQHGFVTASHPVLQTHLKQDKLLKYIHESSPEISLPAIIGEGIYFDDDITHEYIPQHDAQIYDNNMRPRRNSFPGCDAPNKYRIPPPLHGDLQVNKPRPKLSIFTHDINEKKNIEYIEDDDDIMDIGHDINTTKDGKKLHKKLHKKHISNTEKLERFRIQHYEHLTPSLIKLIEAFLDLEKRSTFGSSLTIAASSILSWFFNGYIANKLYNQSSNLTMDGTLSYFMQWISDLIWIPPTYTMDEEEKKIPNDDEMSKLRMEARECIVKIFELYIGDNVPKIIGQKKQLELCMIKFWRFMQQNKLLKHLSFSILDALLQDLFPEKVSRRYQRRAWMANKVRQREENKRRFIEKEEKRREKEKQKRLIQQKMNKHKLKNKIHRVGGGGGGNIKGGVVNGSGDIMEEKKLDDICSKKNDVKNKSETNLLSDKKKKKRIHSNKILMQNQQKNGVHNQKSPSQNLQHRLRPRQIKTHSNINKKHSQLNMKNINKTKPIINNNSRSKSRPMLMDDAPNIDFFSGGSILSDYTKQFMGIGKKKDESSEDDDDESDEEDDDSTESDDEYEERNMRKSQSIGNNIRKHMYKKNNNNNRNNKGFFHKLTGINNQNRNNQNRNNKNTSRNKQNNKNVKDNQIKPEYWMH